MSQTLLQLKKWTEARIALGRSGNAIPTRESLQFKLAHAAARDAVHSEWDYQSLRQSLIEMGEATYLLHSQVQSRAEYLRRPDLGKKLAPSNLESLSVTSQQNTYDLVFIVSDGLSALSIHKHFLPFWSIFRKISGLGKPGVILAPYARVALSDEIGPLFQAKLAVMFIGERPGLTSNDSLGAYLTYAPNTGTQDSSRNCISNIRPPGGLSYEGAAHKLLFLIEESLKRKLSGIALKDETPVLSIP